MNTTTLCRQCGTPFAPRHNKALFCSTRCRVASHRKGRRPAVEPVWLGDGWNKELSDAAKRCAGSVITDADGTPLLNSNGKPKRRIDALAINADGSLQLTNKALAEALLEIANNADGGEPKTARRYYYVALGEGAVMPDMGAGAAAKKSRDDAYERVVNILGDMRCNGMLPWSKVIDLERSLDTPLAYASPAAARASTRAIYDEDRWLGQDFMPVMVVEKNTMEPTMKPIADQWRMPFCSSKGYSSLTLQHDLAKLGLQRAQDHGQRMRILFISDHDPSGFGLQESWETALRSFGLHDFELVRIGLTMGQIEEHDLSRFAVEVKGTDSRTAGYLKRFGRNAKAYEADALPAEVFADAIERDLHDWLDEERWDSKMQEVERARARL